MTMILGSQISYSIKKVKSKLRSVGVETQNGAVESLCSAQTVTRIGLLEEIPRSGVQIPCLS